jgi:hypothetical protein
MELPPNQGQGEDGRWSAYDVSIRGPGPGKTTLDAKGLDTVLELGNDLESNALRGVRITGGASVQAGAAGGVLASGGKLFLRDVVIAGNDSAAGVGGGARLEPRLRLSLVDSRIVHNAALRGGGLYVNSGSAAVVKATIRDATIRANEAQFGGGIYSGVSKLTVEKTTIDANAASEGGGMDLVSNFNNPSNPPPSTVIRSSTISANGASKGGGILADGNQPMLGGLKQMVLVQNSTVAGNHTTAEGGGIMADNGVTVNLNYATVAYNTADTDSTGGGVGGGVHQHSGAVFGLANAIVAKNAVGSSGAGAECDGAFEPSAGAVIESQPTGTCTVPGSAFGVPDAFIGPLAANGGPTQTIRLLSGSPAIGFGHEGCPKRDQRGAKRPNAHCDSGAFERHRP